MVERNMIQEGFIRNTATSPSNPTYSGTQLLDEQQMTAMANGNIVDVAVTVSATEDIILTADLGARWKLDRIELYTNDASTANIDMSISDNDLEYYPVTLTGSPNLYVGDILDSTISGAPRYIRYTHAAVSSLDVFEWKAINDDTLVDFGNDGTQTEVEINDAPVGRPSDQVENLKLFNQFHKAGSAFVFIDNTGTDADLLFEISTGNNGPWFGRQVAESLQPENTPFVSGTVQSTRTVTASGYYLNWFDQTSASGWTPEGTMSFRAYDPDGAIGYTTTSTDPIWSNTGDYTEGNAVLMNYSAGIGNVIGPHIRNILVDTDLHDRVRVRMRVSPLGINDLTEGPRLSWRWLDDANYPDIFPSENSVLSQFPYNNFTGEIQDFIFDVSSQTTWSGAPYHMVRGFELQPFTAVTGTGVNVDVFEIEVYHSSGQERVVLERGTTASGVRPPMMNDWTDFHRSIGVSAPFNTRIKEPCIITKVMAMVTMSNQSLTGCFLVRFTEDDPGYNWPDGSGNNFEVKGTARFQQLGGVNQITQEAYVFWKAEPGDFVWYSSESMNADFRYQTIGSGVPTYRARTPGIWDPVNGNSPVYLDDNQTATDDINSQEEWLLYYGERLNLWFESISIGDYLATGTYTTPIFDGGAQPSLVSSSFTAIEDRGSSIDTNTAAAFKTLRVRASDTPPISSPVLGQELIRPNWGLDNTYQPNQSATPAGTFPTARWINETIYNPAGNDWMINQNNGFVTNREPENTIKNLGGAMMYHPDNDELWVMNVLLSGTAPNDLRPIWDVYDPNSFEYMRTDHLQGQLNYSYEADGALAGPEVFTPVGLIWDDEYDEIHIIQRRPFFFIDSVTYYAITMDTQGNFLRSGWRADSIGGSSTRWQNMVSVTFDGSYFYMLTSNTADSTAGDLLSVIKRGDVQTGDNELVSESAVIDLSTIPGLGGADGNPRTMQCIYNPMDDLVYLFFGTALGGGGDDPRYRNPEMYALKIIMLDTVLVSAVKVNLVDPRGISTAGGVRLAELGQTKSAFRGDAAGSSDDTDMLEERQLTYLPAGTYDSNRQSFNLLQCREVEMSEDWDAQTLVRSGNNWRYDQKTIQFLYSCSAGPPKSYADTPSNARGDDPKWGALSGTLAYDHLQQESALFPPGRYAQVEYTLNSSPDHTTTPQLLTSQLDQGVRVGNIPASGTADLYLRTNIPEDETLGDRSGNLKVFWELPN